MKAAILTKSKTKLTVADINLPSKLSFGQVLVKIKYSGICGAQINEIDAVKGKDKFLPHLLGHEGSGIVEKIGEGVTTVKTGDHVVLHWKKGSGIESATPKYTYRKKIINAGWVTTFNEKAVVSENRITKIPKNYDMRVAPLFGCSLTTAFGVVNNDAKIKIGQSVLIIGTGGVGLIIGLASSLVSANPIIGVDIHDFKLKLGKKYGLTDTLNFSNKDFREKIDKILNHKKADVVIETTGISKMIELAYSLTSENGKTILVGVPNNKINIYSLPLHFDKILKGSHGGSSKPDIDIPNYINFLNSKKIKLEKLITHEFSLSNINEAIKLFRKGLGGRILINMEK
tara:strand:- start:2601 stop:3629 length:1029 start_codon:yes stop_codon:yes gene_type:complete